MSGRFTRLATFVAVLALAGSASADLLAHWQLDDGAGATALDATGNGYNGTLMGNPAWIEGEIGGALDFDGAGDYVDFGNPPDWPAGTAARSMAAMVTHCAGTHRRPFGRLLFRGCMFRGRHFGCGCGCLRAWPAQVRHAQHERAAAGNRRRHIAYRHEQLGRDGDVHRCAQRCANTTFN